ncbi:MAG: hypothetical protein M1819_004197 [Sarea resinae]|nr:MAG: hypothetical protein M1819_004197 [Sarea resinae]
MPAAIVPHRRRRAVESDEDDTADETNGTPSAQPPSSGKRVRLNTNGDASSPPRNPVLPDSYAAEPNGLTRKDHSGVYQPGSIVRVKLTNFVTYTSAEFFPGPSLNMVIGPNGTGKSTLVCAICLGLGWGPQHLGRAKDVAEYVKHGCQEAIIEIELAADPKRQRKNPVISRQIKRQGSKSQFFIDGKPSPLKGVLDLARSFSVQIDNLCQFLPQDKVCEFAALSPVELLHSTQRAAAPEQMLEWHEILKQLRGEQKRVLGLQAHDKEGLANLEARQQGQRADVDRMRERAQIEQRVEMLEKARPFAHYRQARLQVQDAKQRKKDALTALKKLEDEVQPSLRAVNRKQDYRHKVDQVARERRHAVEKAEAAAEKLLTQQQKIQDKIADFQKELAFERESFKKRTEDVPRIKGQITRFKKQMEEKPVDFDPASYNEQIREKTRERRERDIQISELQQTQRDVTAQGRERNEWIARARGQLESLDSQSGQQVNKLRHISRETANAWEWVQNHQDMFEKHVYGPPIVECSVKEKEYCDSIESVFQKNDLLAFTCQTKADFKKLQDQLYGTMRLADITIRTYTGSLDQFRPPVTEIEMHRLGFDGWVLNYVEGPEPVLSMLCGECRIHQTGISKRDTTDEQYAVIETSPVSSWVTSRFSYQITRRREYGAGATSTRVRDIKRAQVWTSQPVDTGAKRELQQNIAGWADELAACKQQINEAQSKITELREEIVRIDDEKKVLEDEKGAKQRAQQIFNALPTKLAQEEEKLAELQNLGAEVKRRCNDIKDKSNRMVLEKGAHLMRYTAAVEALRDLHIGFFQAEIVLIEATSEVEILSERNTAVKNMLEEKRREVQEVVRETDTISKEAKALLEECKRILAEDEGPIQEFLNSLPETQTPEELENEIESEKMRIGLLNDGNPDAIEQFEQRQKKIDRLKDKLADMDQKLADLDHGITEVREKWEPELDALVQKISDAFSHNFEKIGCAGQVGVHKDEDFDQWAIQIQVKFREHEPLTILDSHRQSGGERAVSTIFYLMSLQSLARAPFRVVDEINQGMDPRNERMVHERMVDIACAEHTSQYFLITPKLLHDLKYDRRMRVMCVVSGEYMPTDYREVDFSRCVQVLKKGVGVAG